MPGTPIVRVLIAVLPFLVLAYVAWRLWCLLPLPVWGRVVSVVLVTALVALMPMCLVPKWLDSMPMNAASAIYKTGLSWIFIYIYLLIVLLVLHVLSLVHVIPASVITHNGRTTAAIALLLAVVFVLGNVNYHHKRRKVIDIAVEKPLQRPLKIALLSDLHLGYAIRRAELARWVDKLNAEHCDLVLIAGDIIDRAESPLLKDSMAEEFHRLNAPVYACPGNHEYYTGIADSEDFYSLAGITMLRDSAINVMGINIAGRDDRSNPRRKSLNSILDGLDRSAFTIVLDHQPFHLEEAERAGVDFALYGHTHYGQIWPISWITDAIYEDAYGPLKKGKTFIYVTSGMGIWGGKFRIGTNSEYAVLTLHR